MRKLGTTGRNPRPDADAEGGAPRPSSGHPGVVNMAYADGHVAPLSESVDETVYIRLLSPNGVRHGQIIMSNSF